MPLLRKKNNAEVIRGSGVGSPFIEIFPHGEGYSRVIKQQSTRNTSAHPQAEVENLIEGTQINEIELPLPGRWSNYHSWYTEKPNDLKTQMTYFVATTLVVASFVQGWSLRDKPSVRMSAPASSAIVKKQAESNKGPEAIAPVSRISKPSFPISPPLTYTGAEDSIDQARDDMQIPPEILNDLNPEEREELLRAMKEIEALEN